MLRKLREATDHNYAFWVCLVISIVLLLGGAIVPPPFIIDKSIFIAVSELFAFASLGAVYKALDKGIDTTIQHGNTSVTIGDTNKKEEDEGDDKTDID